MKKYLEIYKTIKNKIMLGEYKSGEKLLSKRLMADKYGCSVITVEAAYNMLSDEGYIISHERSGYYVCELDLAYNDEHFPEKVKIRHLDETVNNKENDGFEHSLWIKTVRKVISEKGDNLFVKSPNKGCAVLRNAISDYLYRYRGMLAQPDRIIIGSGSEQLYGTVVKLLGREYLYGIENPSYPQIESVYVMEGAKVRKLKMTDDGIDINMLQNSDIDVLHVTPFKSYPTGVTTSAQKKWEYLKWAGDEKYIVEDDFNSEFFVPGQPIEPLYSIDRRERVIYINTFSKSLSPSMRMGYMILPPELDRIYNEKLGSFSCSVPVLDQYVLAEFISNGNFERHLNRIRRKNKRKS